MNTEKRGRLVHEKIPDLAWFLSQGRDFFARPGAAASREAASSLFDALSARSEEAHARTLAHRILIDSFLLSEHDRDQNVYLGAFYTRFLTRAVPDLIFQPLDGVEAARALAWARTRKTAVTLRGAGTTAMGGAVPGNGGLLLDLSRLDQISVDAKGRVALVGAGARLKQIHDRVAAAGLALKNYPSNLGGTLAGWFATGNIGMSAFSQGECRDHVRALEVLLPGGEHLRLHDDGRMELLQSGMPHRHLTAEEAPGYLRSRNLPEIRLQDYAGTEGQFGIILSMTVELMPKVRMRPHLVPFRHRLEALRFAQRLAAAAENSGRLPANLKYISLSHLRLSQKIWKSEGRLPGDWQEFSGGYIYVDFESAEAEQVLKNAGLEDAVERDLPQSAAEVLADKFRPQQAKRFGPGMLAAETLLDAEQIPKYLDSLDDLSARARVPLEFEVYHLRGGRSLVISSYLVDPRASGFFGSLLLAPVMTEIAISRFSGSPYVLGRWSAAFYTARFPAAQRSRFATLKSALDPEGLVNGTIFFNTRMRFRNLPGMVFMSVFRPALRVAESLMRSGRLARPASVPSHIEAAQEESARSASCVNCGECNTVCPVFLESKVRLPQMLTHMGERVAAGDYGATESTLLDLCMRCGNCAEACQAGISHLPLYERMQKAPLVEAAYNRSRHELLLSWLRTSPEYLRKFLKVRPGQYLRRTAAALPGVVRHVLRRAETGSGASDTCIHCAACVPVCPTEANIEFRDPADARVITTDQGKCVGCGTCVEICPANLVNGGRTLRVMEAPTPELLQILDQELQSTAKGKR